MAALRRARTSTVAFALLLTCALSASVVAQRAGTPSNVRIDNFGQVNVNYFRGAQPDGRDYEDLAALGVKMIIDLTKDGEPLEKEIVEGLGMKFVRIPMTTRQSPSGADLEKFLTLVNDPANQPIYVHCQGGRHRTGVMTAVYRMTTDGWSADKAFAEMKQYNFGPDFLHPEFKRFVYAYEPQVRLATGTGSAADAVAAR